MSTRRMATSDSFRDIGQTPSFTATTGRDARIVAEPARFRKRRATVADLMELPEVRIGVNPPQHSRFAPNFCTNSQYLAMRRELRDYRRRSLFPVLRRPFNGRRA